MIIIKLKLWKRFAKQSRFHNLNQNVYETGSYNVI